jgi:hypothetical protein
VAEPVRAKDVQIHHQYVAACYRSGRTWADAQIDRGRHLQHHREEAGRDQG